MEEFKWHGFAKVWLWLVFIANIIVLFACFGMMSMNATSAGNIGLSILASVIQIVGAWMLLFKMKKMGFYLIVLADILSLIMNIMSGSVLTGILSAILAILILYLAIKGSWEYLD